MTDYQLTTTDMVIRTADNAWIPNDPDNKDRMQYDGWLAAGGEPDPVKPTLTQTLNMGGTTREIMGE